MAVLFALASAVAFGTADFAGGLAARRLPSVRVTFVSQLIGLPVLAFGLFLVDGDITARALWWGAAAGVSGGLGLVVFYRAMATGPMSVVAPITALLTGIVPVLSGFLLGERPALLAWVGVLGALGAIFLVTHAPKAHNVLETFDEVEGRAELRGVALQAIVAGALFGLTFVMYSRPGDSAGMWPLLAARGVSLPLVGAMLIAAGSGLHIPKPARRTVATAGVLDMAANILVIEAFSRGLLTLVSVVSALYPVTTLILARIVLHERVRPEQQVGLAVAVSAIILISL